MKRFYDILFSCLGLIILSPLFLLTSLIIKLDSEGPVFFRMSLVGPRPEVKNYVDIYKNDYKKLLEVRPGITDPASILYSKEEKILSLSKALEEDYIKKILPKKIELSSKYVDGPDNFLTDLNLIFKTILEI